MSEKHEVVPGESIGPFRLGMTREEIEGLGIEPMEYSEDRCEHCFPLRRLDSHQIASEGRTGVTIEYDASGRSCRLTATFGYSPSKAPVFTLLGHVVNGMTDSTVGKLLRSIASDVEYGYGTVSSASAGLTAVKWEAIDDQIMCVRILPKKVEPID